MIAIRPFDPLSAGRREWAALHSYRRVRNEEDTPDEPVENDEDFERALRQFWPLYDSRRWYAWMGEEIAGNIGANFRREGTQHYEDHAIHLSSWGGVRRHLRRRGIATQLLAPLAQFMREREKSVATFSAFLSESHGFLRAIGCTLKQEQVENRAPAALIDWEMLEGWEAGASAHPGLRWEIHLDRVPRDRMDALIPQFHPLQADIPLGDIEMAPIRAELPNWLSFYEDLDRHGGDHMLVLLMDKENIAALCEAFWDARFPDRVHQWFTAVARPWRGRGLAKAVKAAMMRLIRERHPHFQFVSTGNARENAPMLAINARLGFAEHRRTGSYQIGVEAIERFLAKREVAT